MTEQMNRAKAEAIEKVIEIIRNLEELDGKTLFSEVDYELHRRYARIVIEPLGGFDELEKVEMFASVERGEMRGMIDDVRLMSDLLKWRAARNTEQVSAIELAQARHPEDDHPLVGERGNDVRELASGQIDMGDFRERAARWS